MWCLPSRHERSWLPTSSFVFVSLKELFNKSKLCNILVKIYTPTWTKFVDKRIKVADANINRNFRGLRLATYLIGMACNRYKQYYLRCIVVAIYYLRWFFLDLRAYWRHLGYKLCTFLHLNDFKIVLLHFPVYYILKHNLNPYTIINKFLVLYT